MLLLVVFVTSVSAVLAASSVPTTATTHEPRQLLQHPALVAQSANPGISSHSNDSLARPPATVNVIHNCTLLVQGYGRANSSADAAPQQGVQSAALRCSSTPPAAPRLVMGYDAGKLGPLVASFRGVEVVAGHSCQVDPFVNVTALFYFCVPPDSVVQLWQPVISGVWVEQPPEGKDAALIAVGGNGTMIVQEGRFSNNHESSVFVAASSAVLDISSSSITRNTAKGGTAVLASDQARVRLSKTTVSHNSANFGGAVKLYGFAKVVITDASVLFNNSAIVASDNGNGGAVFMEGDSQLIVTARSKIVNNTSPNGGGVSVQDRCTCSIIGGAVVSDNVASFKTGGGLFLKGDASCNISNAILSNNYAKKQGGAIGLEDGTSTKCFITDRTVVSGNRAEEQGGGLYLGPGSSVVVNGGSQIRDNWSTRGAGVMLIAEDEKTPDRPVSLVMSGAGTTIRNNTAAIGAAINVYAVKNTDKQCLVNVTDAVEIADNASKEGGGAYVSGGMCVANFVGVRFNNNSDVKHSGLMSLYDSARATLVGCLAIGSTAKDGAAFTVGHKASISIVDSIIASHTALHSGGALRVVEDATATLVNSVVRNCSAASGGALVISDNGQVILSNSSLTSNGARISGGAVQMLGPGACKLFMSHGSLCFNNTANISGGCAYLATGGVLVGDNSSSVEGNIARYGGGIALAALDLPPDLHQLQMLVHGNQAAMFSPDIYVDWTDVTLTVQHILSDGELFTAKQLADSENIVPYVSRSSGSGLNVSLLAKGNKGTQAAAGIRIEAQILLDGGATASQVAATTAGSTVQNMTERNYQTTTLGSSTTDNQGVAVIPDLQPLVTPGNYSLVFQYMTLDGIPYSRTLMLHSRPCVLGEVSGDVDVARTCDICPSGSYSLSAAPFNKRCQLCNIQTANCSEGGAVVVPQPRYWQRSPDSALMHRKSTQQADSESLTRDQPSLLTSSITSPHGSLNSSTGLPMTQVEVYLQAQCAPGYTGTLCASCQQGYGTTRQLTCGRCMPPKVLLALYILGALALMCIIRIMMYLSTSSDDKAIKGWTAAALSRRPFSGTSSGQAARSKDAKDSAGTAECSVSTAGTIASTTQHPSCSSSVGASPVPTPFASAHTLNTVVLQEQVPPLPSSILKVLILYMQYMLIIGSLAVDWPASMSRPFTALAGLWSTANPEAFMLDCLLPSSRQAKPGITSQLTADVAAVEAERVPASMVQVLLYVAVPVVMYLAVLLLECMLRATQPWWKPACDTCRSTASNSEASKGDFMPGFRSWRQAHSRLSSSAARRPSERQTSTDDEVEFRNLGEVVMEVSPAAAQAFDPHPAGPVSRSVSYRCFPSAAWCGVLAMVIMHFFLTSLARVALSLFMCFTLEKDEQAVREGRVELSRMSLWMKSQDHECWNTTHKAWALGLGVPLVLLLYVFLPLSVVVLLLWYRHRLTDPWVQRHFGFLYVHYRPNYCLWEVVTILQTLLLAVVSVTANQLGVYNQTLLLNVVLAVILVMLLICKPMASRQVQLLNYASVGVQLFTTYAALSFLVASHSAVAAAEATNSKHSLDMFEIFKNVMGVIVLLTNLAFMASLILILLLNLPWPSALWLRWRLLVAEQCRVPVSWSLCGVACGGTETSCSRHTPSLSVSYTSSGRPVLVRQEAQNAVQMAATGRTS